MACKIRRADYYYLSIPVDAAEGAKVLRSLAERGINLMAFSAVPVGPRRTQYAIFPEEGAKLVDEARSLGLKVDGPHPALLVQGDDELGALAGIHRALAQADVAVYASSGVTDGEGRFGYVLYVQPEAVDRAVGLLCHD